MNKIKINNDVASKLIKSFDIIKNNFIPDYSCIDCIIAMSYIAEICKELKEKLEQRDNKSKYKQQNLF